MKRKTDFVTNSSSTSFIGWGVCFDTENKDDPKINSLVKEWYNMDEDGYFDKPNDLLVETDNTCDMNDSGNILRLKSNNLLVYAFQGYELFIGLHPTDMEDNENLIDFKKRICNKLKELNIEANVEDIKFYSTYSPD